MSNTDKQIVERIRSDSARIEGLLLAHSSECQCYGNDWLVGETCERLYDVVKSILQFAHQSRVRADDEERRSRVLIDDAQKRIDMVTEPLYQKLKESQEEVALLMRLLRVEQPNTKIVS